MKRFICALLAVALLASLAVVPVPTVRAAASDATATPTDGICTCGCRTALNAVQWEPWDPNTTGLLGGHFYLDRDYTHTKQYQINSGTRVVLDLRGHKLTTEKGRLFLIYGYAAVIDTVGGGRLCASATGTANGGAVMVGWDAVAMNDELDATLAIYNCTATLEKDKSGKNGGLFSIGNNCTLDIYNSTLLNTSALERGGAVYATSGATIKLTDSQILGCSAVSAGGAIYALGSTVTIKNCTLTGSETNSYGGNIYANQGHLTIENSLIESGLSNAASNGGGNLYAASSCTVNISDSTVRNGYARTNGGNIFFGKGTQILTNVKINAGVAGNQGANLYCADTSANTTLNNCEISGDVHFESGKLTLTGATQIGMNSTGLQSANATLTTTGLTGQVCMAKDGYCPHCSQTVTWVAAGSALSGHCYLTAGTTLTEGYAVTDDVVLDLRGFDITSSDRAFTVAAGGALTLLDSVGGSTVTASGNAEGLGGVIYNAGTLRVYGGSYTYKVNAEKQQTQGGVIYATGPVAIHGGIFDGSAFNNTASGAQGGALYQADKSGTFQMSAGHFVGGNTNSSGTMRLGGNNTITITGGSMVGGSATAASGNLYIIGTSSIKNGTADISGLYLAGGTAGTNGGNLSIGYYKDVNMRNCFISGGTTTQSSSSAGKGGNIYFTTHAYATLENCVLLCGQAGSTGGNAHTNSNASTITFVDCLLSDGSAATNGGNLNGMNGLITVKGGTIAYGTATTTGGNIYNSVGSLDDDIMHLQANAEGKVPVLAGGSAGTYGGNLYTKGKLDLDAAFMVNGQAVTSGDDLCIGKGDANHLTVGTGVVGTLRIFINTAYLTSNIFGGAVANTAATTLNAQLVLENSDAAPLLCSHNGQLFVGSATVKKSDGSEVWYSDADAAMNSCPADGWIKLYADSTLTLTKDSIVDLNGKTVNVSGNYTLYGMDSTGDEYSIPTGKAQWTSADAVKTGMITYAPNDHRYIALTDGNAVTYHRLGMKLTNVSLRAEKCGIYYKGTWDCDSMIADMVDTYGVAVSVHKMPGSDFEQDPTCLTTTYDGEDLVNGAIKTGVMIKNIMRTDLSSLTNKDRGEMPIYAIAYAKLKNGAVYISDQEGSQDDVAYSLRTTMERMDELIKAQPGLYLRDAVHTARDFYATWKTKGMQTWSFEKLQEPEDDGVLKIIILGSSRSVNTFQLLYEAFKDQMPNQKLELGIMYYSGCSMTMHKKFIETNQPVYQYYHNDNGRWVITPGKYMREGLLAENWDVVMLQAGTGDQDKQMQKDVRNFLKDYIDDYVIDPYELWWHSTWFNSTDPDLYTGSKTPEDAAKVDQKAQLTSTNEAAKAYVLNDPMFAGHIASGTPVMYALKRLGVEEKALFRDHTHLYDLGCLLVGFSWYAQYTGKPVTEIRLNSIPAHLRHSTHQSQGDFVVTQEMKDMIIESVAYTLSDPWSVPWSE